MFENNVFTKIDNIEETLKFLFIFQGITTGIIIALLILSIIIYARKSQKKVYNYLIGFLCGILSIFILFIIGS